LRQSDRYLDVVLLIEVNKLLKIFHSILISEKYHKKISDKMAEEYLVVGIRIQLSLLEMLENFKTSLSILLFLRRTTCSSDFTIVHSYRVLMINNTLLFS
jgi:hypothetical protein